MPHELLDKLIELDPVKRYEMSLIRIEKDLLGEGFDTKCKNYDLDSDKIEETTRSDCITCIVDRL